MTQPEISDAMEDAGVEAWHTSGAGLDEQVRDVYLAMRQHDPLLLQLCEALAAGSSKSVCSNFGRAEVVVRFNSLGAAHRFDEALAAAAKAAGVSKP